MSSMLGISDILRGPTRPVVALFISIGVFTVAFVAGAAPQSQSPVGDVAYAMAFAVVLSSLFAVVWLILRRISNVLSDLTLAVYTTFFFYGYIQGFVDGIAGDSIVRNRFFFSDRLFVPITVIATVAVYFLLSRFVKWNPTLARYCVMVILALSAWNMVFWGVGQVRSYSFEDTRIASGVVLDNPDPAFPIYWMLFDGYGRDDYLAQYYDIDNSDFLRQLGERSFAVNKQATTNFVSTGLILPAMMEMENLGTIGSDSAEALIADRHPPHWRFAESALAGLLGEIGYQNIELSSERTTSVMASVLPIVYYETTAMRAVPPSLKPWQNSARAGFVENMEATAAQAAEQAVMVFSYNLPPHPPYIFDANGPSSKDQLIHPDADARRDFWQQKDDYAGQLEFVNSQIINTVDQILANSPVDPLIIVMSDHGTASNWTGGKFSATPGEELLYERTGILSAIHLPDSCDDSRIAESDASINTFRMVLNSCFGTDLPLEPDDVFWGRIGGFDHYPNAVWSADVGAN